MTIGITIADLLKGSVALLALVPEANIFPYVANEGTVLPLIIYTIDAIDPVYNKDGWANDICDFSVLSISDDYSNLQLIVTEIREALELQRTTDTQRIILTGQTEGFNINEGAFINKLSFKVQINNY